MNCLCYNKNSKRPDSFKWVECPTRIIFAPPSHSRFRQNATLLTLLLLDRTTVIYKLRAAVNVVEMTPEDPAAAAAVLVYSSPHL